MNLEKIWDVFLCELQVNPLIKRCYTRKVAGIPFLYVTTHSSADTSHLQLVIQKSAVEVMKGKQLQAECIFVRMHNDEFVFRHRFYVPLRKMFCCGNMCIDCVRFSK
ncbi:hypothetical protein [Bacillus sp. 165]|uniref:hypothetical protein n=1 Tax=Bacillus sp. 165 TaxID=1529117 RepID=UPI001ADB60A6|nr:hypothetical protein [Bacillus sp. 165]MBO9130287.1 hypothetical protein [Bacillus sp. 165]